MVKGRRKIVVEKIVNEQHRMVTFSKRRKGLFKKAQEFNSKTGSSIAVLVLSQAGRPFVYGAPSFDSVADQFLSSITTYSHQNDLVCSVLNSLSKTTENNGPEPRRLACEDDSSQASTSYANDAVCSSVTDSQSRTTSLQVQNNGEEGQWGVWLDDKFGIECTCETVEKLEEMKNSLVQLRQSVASKILSRHGPEIFFL